MNRIVQRQKSGATARRKLHADYMVIRKYRDSGYSSAHLRRSRPVSQSQTLPARTRSQPPHPRAQSQKLYEDERTPAQYEKYCPDNFEEEIPEFPKISLPLQDLEAALKDLDEHQVKVSKQNSRSKSLPRPAKSKPDYGPRRTFDDFRHFEDDEKDFYDMHDLHDVDYENYKERRAREFEDKRRRPIDVDPEEEDFEFDSPRARRSWNDRDQRYHRGRSEYYERDREDFPERRGRRARSAVYDYERRWGWDEDQEDFRRDRDPEAGRHRRLRRLQTVDETTRAPYRYTPSPERDDWSDDVAVKRRSRPPGSEVYPVPPEPSKEEIKPVPIWLCVFLVASYIVAGTFLFQKWESWAYLDAAYFCFITLTTIGFGDFVPAQGVTNGNAEAVNSIALCSLYLLFGIALLAMSFNLVQEEVRANVASLATKLGIIKPKHIDSESEE